MVATQMGLRARKKQATATALQQSALELFLARGYDETTVQDITDAAGVSQRTFFRYYPTKDAVLLTEHARREQSLRELLAGRSDEAVGELVRAAVSHLVADIEERRDLMKVQSQVFLTVPVLADRFAGHHDRLAAMLAEHVAGTLGVRAGDDPRPHLVGAQVVQVWTTATTMWLDDDHAGDLAAIAERVLTAARNDPALIG
ncbi:MAG TPA: TetR family transcriptional regulator [Acidimicrobiales bacterium]|nr:TetR family transcriptional regulator [Acidimicrobiales bacterium]